MKCCYNNRDRLRTADESLFLLLYTKIDKDNSVLINFSILNVSPIKNYKK